MIKILFRNEWWLRELERSLFLLQHNGGYEAQPKNVNTISRNKQQQQVNISILSEISHVCSRVALIFQHPIAYTRIARTSLYANAII